MASKGGVDANMVTKTSPFEAEMLVVGGGGSGGESPIGIPSISEL